MPAIDWILENLASLLVGLSVFVLAALAVVFLVRNRKQGGCSSSGDCGACPMAGECHGEKKDGTPSKKP